MMTFDELLKNRRSVRKFENRPVPVETLEAVIQDSLLAPSSGNEQSWQFILVSNPELMKDISNDCKAFLLDRIAANPDDYAKKYRPLLSKEDYNIFYNAPALIFIIGTTELKNSEINCTLAASYLMFSAANRGLGTCWISFAKFIRDDAIKQQLGLEPHHFIVAPIIIGYPAVIPSIPPRKPADFIKKIT